MPYLTPQELPTPDDCRALSIPASSEWLALFGGALTELLFTWNWSQSDGGLTVDETITAVQEIIDNWYINTCDCELPEGGAILRLGEDGNLQELINGEWTDPTGDYIFPEPDARTESTSEERRCLAAANAENVLKLMYEDITDSWGESLATIEAIAGVVVFIASVLPIPVSLAVRGLALAALGVWNMAFENVEFITADFWDENFTSDLRCTLLRHSTDTAGVVTFDFALVNQEILSQVDWFDPTLSSFALGAQVRWMLGQITSDGLNLAGATTAITDFDCSICEDCSGDSINFGTGTQGFITSGWESFAGVGTHMSNFFGVGWYADTAGGSNQIGIAGAVDEVCGTGININLSLSGGAPTVPLMKIRVTTSTQVKNATFTPTSGPNNVLWDEGGSLVAGNGLVEIGYNGAAGYAAFIASFQTGDI